MREETKVFIYIVLLLAGIGMVFFFENRESEPIYKEKREVVYIVVPEDTISPVPDFMSKAAKEGLREALIYYDIKFPEIVYAQAVLETGHFKSKECLKHHNLFGLYNSRAERYHRFNHWHESIIAYKELIQSKYKPSEDYYKFLERIGYAEDPEYISKLKRIVKE